MEAPPGEPAPVPAPAETLTGIWTTQVGEDAADAVGAYMAHAYNPLTGRPGLAYVNTTRNFLRFAEWDGSRWVVETVGSGNTGVDLEYSPAGEPTISFNGKGALKLAKKSGGRWTVQTVDSKSGEFTALAFDRGGFPAIAYTGSIGPKVSGVKLARWNGTAWTLQGVDGPVAGRYVSVAFDLVGNPAVAYSDDANGDGKIESLKYAAWNGSGWAKELVESGTVGMGVWCMARFDPIAGTPTIVNRGGSFGLHVSQKVGGAWATTVIDPCEFCGQSPSIAYDPYGVPWIGYANGKNPPEISEVKAAHWDGAAWVPELADATTGGAWTDIAVSPAGQVSVGFRKDYANDAMVTIRP